MVKSRHYIPQRGEVVWINMDPQVGHEQAGRRPATVISPRNYNERTGLAIFCHVTSQVKDYPFEVIIPPGLPVAGAILSDQVKSLDWQARNAELICVLPEEIISEVLEKLALLIM